MTTQKQYTVRSTLRISGLCAVSLLLALSTKAQTLSDHFSGAAIDVATWATNSTHGNGNVGVDSSTVTLDVGSGATTSGNRTTIISQSTELNPFANELTISLNNLTINNAPADPTNAAWGNAFYAAIGRSNGDIGTLDASTKNNYSNVGSSYVAALGLTLRQAESAFHLQVIDRGAGNHTTTSFTLSNAPTDVIWQIDGTGPSKTWSLELVGAVFNDTSLSTANGTFNRFNEAELDAGGSTLISRLALGAINIGNVADRSIVTLDFVSAVPEPATVGILVTGFIGAFVILRRRYIR